jgi:Ca2+-binding RTX toxin-like protein
VPITIDLTTLTAAQGFIIQGDDERDFAGFSVASAGDVNGDGFDDVIIGAFGGDYGGDSAGEAYVIFGKANGLANIDLTNLTSAQGFIIQGADAYDRAGRSVASAGDVNGDGFDDLIIGAYVGDNGGDRAGEAYVIFGKASGLANIDLTNLTSAQGFIIQGADANDYAGRSVASAGDINGDGFDDLIIGAPGGDNGGDRAGEAYVIFGKASGLANIDLTNLAVAQGFIIQGAATFEFAGRSVASAGDVNGDGIDDFIIGAPFRVIGSVDTGEGYVIFGKASGLVNIDLSNLTAAQGFVIRGDTHYDAVGASVAFAGDVNGDGFDDIIIGARDGNNGGNYAGEAYVIFGGASGLANIDLTNLTAAQGFIIQGDAASDNAGISAATAGDVNGDGIDDLIIGAPGGDNGGISAGEAYVIYGQRPTTAVTRVGSVIDQSIFGGGFDDTLSGLGGKDRLDGGGGNDTLEGGTGDDTILGGQGNDTANGGGGNDIIYGGIAAVDATETGDDFLYGNAGLDTIYGNGGNDTISGGLDADYLIGGTGNDTIYGGLSSTDTTDLADDFMRGGDGIDTLYGNGGDDTIAGGAGVDTIYGGVGDDLIYGGALLVDETDAGDTIYGGDGNDDIRGNGGDDFIYGGTGNDSIIGGVGADTIYGGLGNDYLRGGLGADRFYFSTAPNAATNMDTIQAFVVGTDKIVLSQAIFAGIGATLDAAEFQLGAVANDAADRIIYNQATGQLFYDSNGNVNGSTDQVLFATLTAPTGVLTIADFAMVA